MIAMILFFIWYICGCLIAFTIMLNMYIENEKELKKSKTKYDHEYGFMVVGTICSWVTLFLFVYNYIKYNKDE